MKNHLFIFLKGLVMGIADIIPGVSGGTMALITGIYERLISAISSVNTLFLKPITRFDFKEFFANFKKFDFALVIPLFLGIAIAMISMSHLLEGLLINYPSFMYAFFFGLIMGSAFFVHRQAGKRKIYDNLFLLFGLIIGFLVVGLPAFNTAKSLIVIFFAGAIAINAMILPGISGAYLLVIMNQYEYIISAIKSFDMQTILTFGSGALIGLLSFAALLKFLLKNHHARTMLFLTGLMIGTLRMPYNEIVQNSVNMPFEILLGIVGLGVVYFLETKFKE